METLFFIFVALFISSVEGFYNSEPNPCQYIFSDPSNCARYYDCSYYKEYGYDTIRTEHLHCPQGESLCGQGNYEDLFKMFFDFLGNSFRK